MSRCHFPHENHTIILDFPSLSNIDSTMLLIETHKNITYSSVLSLSCFEKQIDRHEAIYEEDSLGLLIQDEEDNQLLELEADGKKKKANKQGCTCKKTNCLKMYCECFSKGQMCTPECACFGCHNHSQHQDLIEQAKEQLKQKGNTSNRHTDRACNCKKSQCQKKYCECYNAGYACTEACNCCDCCNKQSGTSKHTIAHSKKEKQSSEFSGQDSELQYC